MIHPQSLYYKILPWAWLRFHHRESGCTSVISGEASVTASRGRLYLQEVISSSWKSEREWERSECRLGSIIAWFKAHALIEPWLRTMYTTELEHRFQRNTTGRNSLTLHFTEMFKSGTSPFLTQMQELEIRLALIVRHSPIWWPTLKFIMENPEYNDNLGCYESF